MIKYVVDTTSCAQLSAYLNRSGLDYGVPVADFAPTDDEDEDEPDQVSDETLEEIITVVVNNDERVEVLEEELERYRKELANVRGAVIGLGNLTSTNADNLWDVVMELRAEVDDLRLERAVAACDKPSPKIELYGFNYDIG